MGVAMGLRTATGVPVSVGAVLARGGQGEVLDVPGRPDVVFKRYKAAELGKDPGLTARLRVMTRHRPSGWKDTVTGRVLLTWPTDLVYDAGLCVGYLMPRVDVAHSATLVRVADPSDRASASGVTRWLAGLSWRRLLDVAINLAAAVGTLHEAGVVIGDFNDSNVAVTPQSTVTLFDCDSMQISDPVTGERYFCRVFRPDFIAPELDGVDLASTYRPVSSDLFALAVHLHLLLLQGEHPFRGFWRGDGDPPLELALAKQGLWTHGGSGRTSPRPAAIPIDLLPPDIIDLFRRAFVVGAAIPGQRPTPREWCESLTELSTHLEQCLRGHWFPAFHQRRCPWCAHALAHHSRPPRVPVTERAPRTQVKPTRSVAVPGRPRSASRAGGLVAPSATRPASPAVPVVRKSPPTTDER